MARFGLVRVLACLLAFSAVVQGQQYVFRAFRQAEGLNNLSISSLERDRNGFLWMGTENGVYRFLGSGFERYGVEQGITDLDIRGIVSDPNGTVWVATDSNLYRWDGQRFLPAGRDPIHVEGKRRVVVEDSRHLLIVQKGHLYRLEHDSEGRMLSFLPLFPDKLLAAMPDMANVSSLTVVRERNGGIRFWAGCGKGLCSWLEREAGAAGDWTALQGAETGAPVQLRDGVVTEWGTDRGLAADRWAGVLLDHKGTLWAGGATHVAVLLPGAADFVDRTIAGSESVSRYSHAPLIEDPEGRILAPAKEGIGRWTGSAWQIIGKANGMERVPRIVDMTFDAAGDLWFGSRGDGLYEWAGYEDWGGWGDQQNLPSANTWAIALFSKDRVFVATDRGPAWINPRNGSSGPLSDGRQWAYGQMGGMFVDRDGSLVAGTASGAILRINPKTGRIALASKVPAHVVNALQDSSGRIYFETLDGIYLREAGAPSDRSSSLGWKAKGSPTALPRVKAVDALMGDSSRIVGGCKSPGGDLWFLGNNRLARLKDGVWTAPLIKGLSGMRGTLAAVACAPDGAIWVTGDQTGTWRLTVDKEKMQASQLELPADLRTLAPLAILVDHRGWVWLGSDMGLLVWNGHSWRQITQENGLIWNDVNEGVMQEAADGSLWIGTSGGVSHLLYPERVFDAIPLTVYLTDFRRGETSYLGARQVTMPWAGSPLILRISSPTMRNRSELTLKIRMVGYQSEWMETHSGNATFPRLPPGSYTFMAIACNPGLNGCSVPVKVDIKVLPPWWRTNWFYVLCFLLGVSLLTVSGRLYVMHLRATSVHLEMLIQERTKELEASREQLRIQATHDGLTGMLNRVAILRALMAEMDRALREKRTLVVALIDLDHFKRINDRYGHLAGDEALRWFAAAVGAAIRPYDRAGRYGGEEFLLVLTQVPLEAVEQRLVSLQNSISNLKVCARESEFTLNCSMGATVFDPLDRPATVESLLAIADEALYAAKAEGRNRVVFRTVGVPDSREDTLETFL
ncbi:MAG: diguanylate cyclase [Terracidiphilus sp.]|jgi:diguanylate cyclase (GGDEF)-like protein